MDNIKKIWRVYTVIFLLTLACIIFYFIKNSHLCPKGTLWTGSQCSGTGININQDIKNNTENELLIRKFISEGCIYYYDGCNKCSVNMDESGFSCTEMGCSIIGKPKCLSFSKKNKE